jgi:hypothetical protein
MPGAGRRGRAGVRALEHEGRVDLVGQDHHVRAGEHLGQRGQFPGGVDGAGRVAGRVEQQHLRARRERGAQRVGAQLEAASLLAGHVHDPALAQRDHRLVADPRGRGQDHLGVRIDEREQRQREALLRAAGHDHLAGGVGHARALGKRLRGRRAQLGQSAAGGVVHGALRHEVLRSADRLGRRGEIRLAGAQADHVHARLLQLGHLRRQRQGGGSGDGLGARRKLHM